MPLGPTRACSAWHFWLLLVCRSAAFQSIGLQRRQRRLEDADQPDGEVDLKHPSKCDHQVNKIPGPQTWPINVHLSSVHCFNRRASVIVVVVPHPSVGPTGRPSPSVHVQQSFVVRCPSSSRPGLLVARRRMMGGRETAQLLCLAKTEWFGKLEEPLSGTISTPAWKEPKRSTEYEDLKKKWTDRLLTVLLTCYPQLKGKIELADVSTPLSIEHYLPTGSGSAIGLDTNGDVWKICKL